MRKRIILLLILAVAFSTWLSATTAQTSPDAKIVFYVA